MVSTVVTTDYADVGDAVTDLINRVKRLEQQQSSSASTALPPDAVFTTVTVNTNLLATASAPPTGLTAVVGVFLDNIYVDIGWTAPVANPPANEYQIEVAQKIAGVYQAPTQYRTSGTNFRVENLIPNTTYGIRVFGINKLGISSVGLGDPANTPTHFKDVTTGQDTTIPSNITGVSAGAGLRSMVVTWTDSTDFDFDVYQFEIATNSGFTTGVRDAFPRGSISGFTDLLPATTYWYRIRAFDTSGNVGAWTAGASVTTTTLQAGDIPPLYIDNTMIANATILTAKIANAQITDALIHDLSVNKINITGTMTTTDFILGTGGQIKTAGITPGFVINASGITFYNSSGTPTIFLNAGTGSGTFVGTIAAGTIITAPNISGGTITAGLFRSAASGARLEIQTGSVSNTIFAYTGNAGELDQGEFGVDSHGWILSSPGFYASNVGRSQFILAPEYPGQPYSYAQFGSDVFVANAAFQIILTCPNTYVTGNLSVLSGAFDVANNAAVHGSLTVDGHIGGPAGGNGAEIFGWEGHLHSFSWANSSPYGGAMVSTFVESTQVLGVYKDASGTQAELFFDDGTGEVYKTFVIQHPTKPDRLLVHATVEGREARVEYVGVEELDSDGEAWVELPDYFEALTRKDGRRVDPTPYDTGFGDDIPVLIATYPVNGRFHVRSSLRQPCLFSYVVSAVRADGPQFDVEPLRSAVRVRGDGPYTYATAV